MKSDMTTRTARSAPSGRAIPASTPRLPHRTATGAAGRCTSLNVAAHISATHIANTGVPNPPAMHAFAGPTATKIAESAAASGVAADRRGAATYTMTTVTT